MFEDIKKMLPARVKATTGLLIEPHFLERSKIKVNRPIVEDYQKETNIKFSDTTIIQMENNQYEMIVDADLSENIIGENNQYESFVDADLSNNLTADNYQYDSVIEASDDLSISSDVYQNQTTIDAGLGEPTILTEIDLINSNTIAGQSVLENIGFGIYAQSGSAIRTYFGTDGSVLKERVRVNLITEQKSRHIVRYAVTSSVTGLGDPRGGFVSDTQTYTETNLNIQPFANSVVPSVGGNIISVENVDGYLRTHYKNTNDLTSGMRNSFFRGSKNTAATTLDGSSPVEVFTTNPNTLKVNKAGRDSSEPILEVE
jgi:archaellin